MKNKKELEQKIIDSEFKESIDELFEKQEKQQVDFLGTQFFIQEDGFLGSDDIVSKIEKNKNSKRLIVELKSLLEERLIHYKDLQAIAVRLANLGLWKEASLILDGFGYFPIYGHKDFVSINEEANSEWFVYAKYKLILSIIKDVGSYEMKEKMINYLANINRFDKILDFIESVISEIWLKEINRKIEEICGNSLSYSLSKIYQLPPFIYEGNFDKLDVDDFFSIYFYFYEKWEELSPIEFKEYDEIFEETAKEILLAIEKSHAPARAFFGVSNYFQFSKSFFIDKNYNIWKQLIMPVFHTEWGNKMAKEQLKSFIFDFKFPMERILSLSKYQDSKGKKEFFSFLLTIAEENEKEAIKFYLETMLYSIRYLLFKDQDIVREAKEFLSFLPTNKSRKK